MSEEPNKNEPCVLVAIDGSPSSNKAAEYAASVASLIPGLKLVLLNILPQTPPLYRDEARTDGGMMKKLKSLEKKFADNAVRLMDEAKELLTRQGFPPESIETRVRPYYAGLPQDILNVAEMGRFDALVVGRRGLSRAQELFTGSVSNQLIQHAANVPLWINSGRVEEPRVMIAVDGSPAGLRAVDHAAFMLGTNPEAEINLFHVSPKLQNFCPIGSLEDEIDDWEGLEEDFRRDREACLDDFMAKAVRVIEEAGISRDRITVDSREVTLGVARTIIKAAKEGKYGTIVLGRRGFGKSSILGGVTDRLVRWASDKTIWLVN